MTEDDPCTEVMNRVHAFLHGELSEGAADEIREHLIACEHCVDSYDVEACIDTLLKRCAQVEVNAPVSLRVRIAQMVVRGSGPANSF